MLRPVLREQRCERLEAVGEPGPGAQNQVGIQVGNDSPGPDSAHVRPPDALLDKIAGVAGVPRVHERDDDDVGILRNDIVRADDRPRAFNVAGDVLAAGAMDQLVEE